MDIKKNWPEIVRLLENAFDSIGHYAVATVGEDGTPNVAPIGSLCLRDDGTGFYFEVFVNQTTKNIVHNPRICVALANGSRWFWLKSLFLGRFVSPPGVKLYGKVVGEKREATPEEIQIFRKRLRQFRFFKGYDLLWRDFDSVRDVEFDRCEPINLGQMGSQSWR